MALEVDDRVVQTAQAYFNNVANDLLAWGGVLVNRADPVRTDYRFVSVVFDQLALTLARKYAAGDYGFETADWLANTLEGELTELFTTIWPKGDIEVYPHNWSRVYEAFDADEFDHFGRSADPVKDSTGPQIREFLAECGGANPRA